MLSRLVHSSASLHNLVLHGRIGALGGRCRGLSVGLGGIEVVCHLGIELVSRLLGGSSILRASSATSLGRGSLATRSRLCALARGLVRSGRLRLGLELGLSDTLAQRGRLGNRVSCDDDLDLVSSQHKLFNVILATSLDL